MQDEEIKETIKLLKECLQYVLLDKEIMINDMYGNFTENSVKTF